MQHGNRPSIVRRVFVVTVAISAVVLGGCASSAPPDTVAVRLHGAGGNDFSMQVSSTFVRDAVESALGSSLECKATVDEPLSDLLLALESRGPHSKASVQRGDELVQASRHGRRLRLTLVGDDGQKVEIRMPWAVAECLLGREASLHEALAHSGGRPTIEVRIAGRAGGRFKASLE